MIPLGVFVLFAVFYLKEPAEFDYLWAVLGALEAVYFVFRGSLGALEARDQRRAIGAQLGVASSN
jgi:hypothetical protein